MIYMSMKRGLIYVLVLAMVTGVMTGCRKKNQESEVRPTPTATPTPEETQLAPELRPRVELEAIKVAKEYYLVIGNLPDDVASVDFELTYLSGTAEKGSLGTYYVDEGKEKILLGSCSSGVCNYDPDVSKGMLTLEYETGGEDILLRYELDLNAE